MLGYPINDDILIGDGGNIAVYERPDGSRYGLDREGRGRELCWGRASSAPPDSTHGLSPMAAGPDRAQ